MIEPHRENFAKGPKPLLPFPKNYWNIPDVHDLEWGCRRLVIGNSEEDWNDFLSDLSPSQKVREEKRIVRRWKDENGVPLIETDEGPIWVGRLGDKR